MNTHNHNLLVTFCKNCLTPTTRPRVGFDKNGICNACNYVKVKDKTNWLKRKNELLRILDRIRSKTSNYDCIVPWSGGKDSSYVAYKLKFDFGMTPLLAHFSPLISNEVGEKNKENFLKLGFDCILVKPNSEVSKHLSRRFFEERGNPKVHWDAGAASFPVKIAEKFNIKAIFYAEHAESEYGGKVLSKEHLKMYKYDEVVEHWIEDYPSNWVDDKLSMHDLQPYMYPDINELKKKKINAYFFSYFQRFDMYKNYLFIKKKTEFKTVKRTIGTFTNFDSLDDRIDDLYYYMQYIKFGFGRSVRDGSRLIQNGHLTRKKALEYAKKYDGEFPSKYVDLVLDYYKISRKKFNEIIDKHRNREIWTLEKNKWSLIQNIK